MIELPARWTPLRLHEEQQRLMYTDARFRAVECGRRSGKTEIAILRMGILHSFRGGMNIVLSEPTHQQAKRVLWDHAKALIPAALKRRVFEGDMRIEMTNESMVFVGGMDAPQRFEGFPIDFLGCDEAADMRPEVYEHLRPSLDTPGRPPGEGTWAGTPDDVSGAWFADLCDSAKRADWIGWDYFSWPSAGVVDPQLLEDAKRTMPEDIFLREFYAQRITASGRVYYAFDEAIHVEENIEYDPDLPLVVTLDFNVDPGVALILQEQYNGVGNRAKPTRRWLGGKGWTIGEDVTVAIDEVFIPRGSNTPRVMREVIAAFPDHKGDILLHGDPAGGSRSTQVEHEGGDWRTAIDVLEDHYGTTIYPSYAKRPPGVRTSVASVNARLRSATHEVSMLVHPRCERLIRDLNYVRVRQGLRVYDIDKDTDKTLTHLSDALRYYIQQEHAIAAAIIQEHGWG